MPIVHLHSGDGDRPPCRGWDCGSSSSSSGYRHRPPLCYHPGSVLSSPSSPSGPPAPSLSLHACWHARLRTPFSDHAVSLGGTPYGLPPRRCSLSPRRCYRGATSPAWSAGRGTASPGPAACGMRRPRPRATAIPPGRVGGVGVGRKTRGLLLFLKIDPFLYLRWRLTSVPASA